MKGRAAVASALALETIGFAFGKSASVSADAILVLASALAIGRIDLRHAGMLSAYASAFTVGSVIVSGRLVRQYSLGGALLVSLLAMVVYDLVGADLSDRFYYVPIALIAALAFAAKEHPAALAESLTPSNPAADDLESVHGLSVHD